MKTRRDFLIENAIIVFGTILLNVAFYFFFLPNELVTGGVLGLSVIINHYGINPSYTVFVLNGLFLIAAFVFMGKRYGIRSIFTSLLSPVIIFIFEQSKIPQTLIIDQLTEAPLLMSAVLGSVLTGVGLGLVFRNGGSTGGVDILQNILNQKLHVDYKTIFLVTDGIVVLVGLVVFKDIQMFLFAIGSIMLFSIIIDNLSISGRAGHTLFIVTEKADEVKEQIYKRIKRGTTIINARGGYSEDEKNLIICVINRRQLNLARHVISEADPDAFTFIAQTKEAVGRGFTFH